MHCNSPPPHPSPLIMSRYCGAVYVINSKNKPIISCLHQSLQLTVVGDLHGQLPDLNTVLYHSGMHIPLAFIKSPLHIIL